MITLEVVELYNLLQLGCNISVNELDYFTAKYLMYLHSEIEKENQRKMRKK